MINQSAGDIPIHSFRNQSNLTGLPFLEWEIMVNCTRWFALADHISCFKDPYLTETLQIAQLILFTFPVITLGAMGVWVLTQPVCIINRRWYLLIFLPLILANSLAVVEDLLSSQNAGLTDWRFWLVMATDAALVWGVLRLFRGFILYGLDEELTRLSLAGALRDQGYEVQTITGSKSQLLGSPVEAQILTITNGGTQEEIWVTTSNNEVRFQAGSRKARIMLKETLPALHETKKVYSTNAHIIGVLYIVLGVLLAVVSWIFFFEPRIILLQ